MFCNTLVAAKEDWQYELSSRVLQQAVADLANAWKNFLAKRNPVGVNLNSSLKKPNVKVSRQTVLSL